MKKMLKKETTFGFTLVELLAVIIILGIIALITFPIVDKSIENSKQAALEQTIDSILDAAHNYSSQNNIGYSTEENKLALDELKKDGTYNRLAKKWFGNIPGFNIKEIEQY